MPSAVTADRNESAAPEFQWDELCDLLGGARWEEALARSQVKGLDDPARHSALSSLTLARPGSSQLLFPHSQNPLRCLWLKWSLFTSLCHELLARYKDLKRPHLGLNPRQILVHWTPGTEASPAGPTFTLHVLDDSAASPLTCAGMPDEMARWLLTPRSPLPSAYAAPAIRDWPVGREVPVTVLIQSMDRLHDEAEGPVRGILRLQTISEAFSDARFSERDVFRLMLGVTNAECDRIAVWCRQIEASDSGIVVGGVTDPMPPAVWTRLEGASRQVFSDAKAAVYRALDPSCDLYSLGVLLAYGLLVNRRQDVGQVTHTLNQVVGGLDPLVTGLDPGDSASLFNRISARLNEVGHVFGKSSVLFDEQHDTNGAIPDDVWYDALIVVLQLMSRVPQFSICSGQTCQHLKSLHADIESLTRVAEGIGQRIRIELFGREQRSRDMVQACQITRRWLAGLGAGRHAH
jgi:hypothetical protein